MIQILERFPFGFVIELENERAYFSEAEYQLYLDDVLYGTYRQNVIAVFGLAPDRLYHIRIKTGEETFFYDIKTEELNYLLDIRDYNAAGDGVQDDTSAINTAIYTAAAGSVVFIPAGTYLVNQIYLKSGVDIYLEKGSCIKQHTDRRGLSIIKGYQKNYNHTDAKANASWEGNPLDTYCGVFFGYEANHIRLYGEGVIDGSGSEGGWWEDPKNKHTAFRPKNIFLNRCRNITICGLESKNSACWNIHPFYCSEVNLYYLSLISEKDSPNTDGINPESCTNVNIVGCHFDVGDDCIAIKSGKYFMSEFHYQPCENITIRNCYMGSGHGGIAIGSEISCGVRNLTVEQCYMDQTDRGIRIKTRRGRGERSVLKNIRLLNLQMNEVCHCLGINMFYHCDPDGKSDYVKAKSGVLRDALTPEIQDIEISGMNAKDIKGCAIFMYGLPESKIGKVTIKGCHFSFNETRINEVPEMLEDFEVIPDLGIFIKNASQITMADNEFQGHYVSVFDEEENDEGN